MNTRRHTLRVLALAWLLCLTPSAFAGGGKVFLSTKEALELAFPKAEIVKSTEYLDEAQEKRASKLAGKSVGKRVVHAYEARNAKGELLGTAYFDTHKVRSKKETVMIVVDPAQRIRRVEVLAFAEPLEYIPRGNFYGQFKGRALDADLAVGRKIRGVAGATLTTRATVEAARRVLALHQVVREAEDAGAKG